MMKYFKCLKIKSKLALLAFVTLLGLAFFRDNPPGSIIPNLCVVCFGIMYFCIKRDIQDNDRVDL